MVSPLKHVTGFYRLLFCRRETTAGRQLRNDQSASPSKIQSKTRVAQIFSVFPWVNGPPIATIVPGNSDWIIRAKTARLLRFPVQGRYADNVRAKLLKDLTRLKIPSVVGHEIEQANLDVGAELLA
jgi:hypothetical protein